MIKGPQIKELPQTFHYIIAITKPKILLLLKEGKFQLSLFNDNVVEIVNEDIRYILRRNPIRQQELQQNRDKLTSVTRLVLRENKYLQEHPKASTASAMKRILSKIKRLKLNKWVKLMCNFFEGLCQRKRHMFHAGSR